jgi:tetratricopeptide (TPR) repeat protein
MKETEIIEQIHHYLNGDLDNHAIELLWESFIVYPEYLDYLETEAELRSVLRESTDYILEDNQNSSIFNKWSLAIAAVLLITIGLQFFNHSVNNGTQNYSLDKISVNEMASMDVYRSSEDDINEFNIEFNRGFEAAITGRDDESLSIFEGLMETDLNANQATRAFLNIGILLYNKGEVADAADAFRNVLVINSDLPDYLLERAWWFLGNSLVKLEDYHAASEALQNVVDYDDYYKDPAQNLLTQINIELEKTN